MSEPNGLRAAVSAGVLPSEDVHRALLKSIVEVARAIFSARGASIFLLDEQTDELVFEAVANPEDEHLVGLRFPSGAGVAGWVLVTRQPIVIEDVTQDPRFAKDVAEATGYVPKGLMAVPLLHEEDALGVLEVLDRPQRPGFALMEMDLLALFASQAAIALDLLRRARRAHAALAAAGGEATTVARLAGAIEALEGERREAALRLVEALATILADQAAGAA